jgi:hypothetical protein
LQGAHICRKKWVHLKSEITIFIRKERNRKLIKIPAKIKGKENAEKMKII